MLSRGFPGQLLLWRGLTSLTGHPGAVPRVSACSQVSKPTFVRAMGERGSVILVPGGQAELLYTGRLTHNREFVIWPRHKGAPKAATSRPCLHCLPACLFQDVVQT